MEMLSKVREARAGGIGRLGYRRAAAGVGDRRRGFTGRRPPFLGTGLVRPGIQVRTKTTGEKFGGETACAAWGVGSAGLCPIMNSAFP